MLIEKGLVREDVLNQDLLQRISRVDEAQIANESASMWGCAWMECDDRCGFGIAGVSAA